MIREHDRVLVTGGAGFIGSALVWALNERGHDRILVADRPGAEGKARNLASLRYDDWIDADALPGRLDTLDDVRLVLHMGACSSTTEMDREYLRRNNVDYTTTLAGWAIRRGVRFVYASSAATYGGREGLLEESLPLEELQPLNPYGESKQLVDLHAAREGWLDHITGLKYFNVFGPNEQHKGDMRSMVDKAYRQITETGRVRLFRSHRPEFGDGEQKRDFIYVKDAVAMTLHLAERPAYGLFNLGSGVAHTWLDLATGVFAALGREPAIDFVDMPVALQGRYQYHTRAAIDRLRSTGYDRPITPFADAIADYVRHYLVPGRQLGE